MSVVGASASDERSYLRALDPGSEDFKLLVVLRLVILVSCRAVLGMEELNKGRWRGHKVSVMSISKELVKFKFE